MAPHKARKVFPIAVTVVAVVVLLIALLPYMASTNLVRERIAQQVSSWSGYRVTLSEAPDIDVFPSLTAVLHGVTVYSWAQPDKPIMQADSVEAGLSLISAFQGDADINTISLFRPRFDFIDNGIARLPVPAGGELSFAIRTARHTLLNDGENGPSAATLAAKIGTFRIIDGRIALPETAGGDDDLTSVDAVISWPMLQRPLSITADAIWRGEEVTLVLDSPSPVDSLSGKPVPIIVDFSASPASVQFDGKVSLTDKFFYDGKAEFSSPSLRHALDWYGAAVPALAQTGKLAFSGAVSGDRQRVRVEDARIVLGDTGASGFLEISRQEKITAISGTLAFDQLDLLGFLGAFGGVPDTETEEPGRFDLAFFDNLHLDLRLSATNASAGPVDLQDAAATVQVKEDIAAFDLSGANGLGGTVQAGLQIDRADTAKTGEVRIIANEIDSDALANAIGLKAISPKAPLTISTILRGPARNWQTLLRGANGSVSARFDAGSIEGFDLNLFSSKLSESGFFPMREVNQGTTDFDMIDMRLAVGNGIARIEKAQLTASGKVVEFTGLIAPFANSIALSGSYTADSNNESEASRQIFFLGGTPESPFVTPILPAEFAR